MEKQGTSWDKLPKYLKKSDIETILENANENRKRDYLLILTLFRTGVRVDELTSLKKRDIDFSEQLLTVRDGKGGKDRVIPIEDELSNLLGFYTDDMSPNDVLFDVSNRHVSRICKKYAPEHLRERVSPHKFRHSFGVYCIKQGMNLRTLQKILGHSDLSTTQVYLDLAGEDVKEDFSKVEW